MIFSFWLSDADEMLACLADDSYSSFWLLSFASAFCLLVPCLPISRAFIRFVLLSHSVTNPLTHSLLSFVPYPMCATHNSHSICLPSSLFHLVLDLFLSHF